MIKFTTNAETEQVKSAFLTFIESQKEAIGGFLTTIIKDTGANADAQLKIEGDEITLYQLAPDKGYVLAETGNPELPIQLGKYLEVPAGNKYVNQEKDLTVLYLRKPEGVADVKLGVFKSINDAVKEFNSESVKTVLKNLADREAAVEKQEAKTERRLEKLGKIKEAKTEQAAV